MASLTSCFVPGLMSHVELAWEDPARRGVLRAPGRDRAADPVRQAPRRLVRAREAMGRFERMAISPSTYLRMLRLIHEIDVATRS